MSYCAIEEAFTPLVPGGPKKSKKTRSVVVPAAPAGSDQETKEYSIEPNSVELSDISTSRGDLSGRDLSARDPLGRDPDRPAQRPPPANDILSSPVSNGRLESLVSSNFFPMQGDNAEPEAWQKAFLLGDMSSQVPKPSFQVDQKPTLWRSIPKSVSDATSAIAATSSAFVDTLAPIAVPDEIHRRLDSLSKQLDSLTFVTPMQNTAELFLFVAIGLLLLLAIDTLLRYATATATATANANTGLSSYSSPLQVMAGGSRGGRRYR